MQQAGAVSRLLLLMALMLAPAAASAAQDGLPAEAEPLTGAEFEALTTGHTLTYGFGGKPYGIERYMAGRRVIWAFLGDECREGHWFEDGERICFVYDDTPGELHCWRFFEADQGLLARIVGAGGGSGEMVEVRESPEPMHCPGPRVGV